MRLTIFLLGVAAMAGCKGSSGGPSCGAAAGQFFKVATDELAAATTDDTKRRQVHDQLPAMRDAFDMVCVAGHWEPVVRACIVAATSHAQIEACEARLAPAQRVMLDKSARDVDPTP